MAGGFWFRKQGEPWKAPAAELLPFTGKGGESELQAPVEIDASMLPLPVPIRSLAHHVPLGGGLVADILAVDADGRLAIVEAKLNKNTEISRDVIAQAIEYASVAHQLGADAVIKAIEQRAGKSLTELVEGAEFQFGEAGLEGALRTSIESADMRMVLLIDVAPERLKRIVHFLREGKGLPIDVVEVARYDLGGIEVAIPRLVDLRTEPVNSPPNSAVQTGTEQLFIDSLAHAKPDVQPEFERLLALAHALPGVVAFRTNKGSANTVLHPLLPGMEGGLIAIWNASGKPWLTVNTGAIAAMAPSAWQMLLRQEPGIRGKQGFAKLSDPSCVAVREILLCAYEEAATAGT